MPIINRGVFDLNTVYLREVGNDGPTAQVLYTQDVLETAGNLYYTNARVVQTVTPLLTTANVVELAGNLYFTNARVIQTVTPLLTTANVIESGSNLYYTNARVVQTVTPRLTTANVVELAGNLYYNEAKVRPLLTTANVTESTANLYFTTERARSAYTAGLGIAISANGVISSKGDDTGLGVFNAGINLANALILSNNFANLITFDNADGLRHLVYSLHLTNFSNQTAYVTGRYVSGSNTILFSNLFEMPASSFVEYQVKPQIFYPGDQIQFRSFSSPNQAANNLVSALISYQASQDTNFIRVANVINNNNNSNIFTTTARTTIFEGIKIVNPNPADIPVSVWIADNNYNIFAFLAANVVVPSFSSIELCDYPKALREDFTIRARKNSTVASNPLNFFLSGKYTTQYIITPSALAINEGGIVTFNVDTLNVGDGTLLYYTLQGNVTQTDFITPTSGSITISSNRGTLNLQLRGAPDATDVNDFILQLRKNSISGPILATSDRIYVSDTANALTTTIIESASRITEGSNISFTLNTYGVQNQTIYYSTNVAANPAFFIQGNTGSLALVNNTANLTLTSNSSLLAFGQTALFSIDFRTDNASNGTIFATSNVITIQDSSYVGTSASSVRMLMVAGGGGAGFSGLSAPTLIGGGGGGGGLLEVWSIPVSSNTYNITVGAGGTQDSPGSNTIVEYGITGQQYVTVGGGGGQPGSISPSTTPARPGSNGGSGGGGSGNGVDNGFGYTGQGSPGGTGFGSGPTTQGASGGGGGAGQAGGNGGTSPSPTGNQGPGGKGGDGKVTTLTGSANTYFAGGGGGGGTFINDQTGVHTGLGGLGGGGMGGLDGPVGITRTAGFINTGGGGGAGTPPNQNGPGTAGGSGIVVVNYPNAFRIARTTGNVSVTTANNNVIIQFYSSGTIAY